MIKKVITVIFLFAVVLVSVATAYLYYLKPTYNGTLKLTGIKNKVDVFFDDYAIPHIYAQSEEDAWTALGYVHAQDRLFQMELLRRVGGGRLAEIFGKDLVDVDKMFRTLGIAEIAKRSAEKFFSAEAVPPSHLERGSGGEVSNTRTETQQYKTLAYAYMNGVNQYIQNGKTPVEFTMLGIEKKKFIPEDFYLIIGYMGFSFTEAFRTDPILSRIKSNLGEKYYNDIAHGYVAGTKRIPVYSQSEEKVFRKLTEQLTELEKKLPIGIWSGSNGWAVAPSKSKSGKVLFENDTHIAHAAPCVWYEAHIETPGYSLYGNFLAGFPFPLVGHTRTTAWGMTMFENDDFNFYRERQNPQNQNQYWHDGVWKNYAVRKEIIDVKGEAPVQFIVKATVHGPLVSGNDDLKNVVKEFDSVDAIPVSEWWIYNLKETQTLEAGYELCHATNVNEMQQAVSKVNAPGINLMYGDAAGNIAWWAAGQLYKLPNGVDCKLILDGANGVDDKMEFLPFSENPHSINPPDGFVFSANNQPDSVNGFLVPGYFAPGDRAERISNKLSSNTKVDLEFFKTLATDFVSDKKVTLAKTFCDAIKNIPELKEKIYTDCYQKLLNWNGDHQTSQTEPAIFYTLLSHIMQNCMMDEMGEDDYHAILSTHTMKNTHSLLCSNDSSVWWDDVTTKNKKETRTEIISKSFLQTVNVLSKWHSKNPDEWTWGKMHTVEHPHPVGRQKPFDKIFNVGPLETGSGNEVINVQGFALNTETNFNVTYGPAMRICIDFNDVENAVSILPAGQSGYFFSKHYDDQALLYTQNKFRKMMMNKSEILQKSIGHLKFE